MPEAGEVRIIVDGLTHLLGGKKLTHIEINEKSRYHKKTPDGFTEFTRALPTKLVKVDAHGKFVWWEFANGWHIWQTLGLSGGWFLEPKSYSGVVITMSDKRKMYYDDQRHFGTLKFIPPSIAQQETAKKIAGLGPDMLAGDKIDKPGFIARLRKRPNQVLAHVIMDQKVIAGVGNYLRSETLYKARFNPHHKVSDMTDEQLGHLFDAARDRILASYKAGGASIQHYSDIYSHPGKFEFMMQVYGRKKTPDGLTVKAEKIGNDSQTTYWCPERQI